MFHIRNIRPAKLFPIRNKQRGILTAMSRKPPSELDRHLAKFLKKEMSARGMTYRDMAKEIGCSYSSVHRAINLDASASLQLVHQICRAFKVSVHDIFPRR